MTPAFALTLPVMFEFRTRTFISKKEASTYFFYRGTQRNPIPKIHLLPSLLFDTWGGLLFFKASLPRRRRFGFLLDHVFCSVGVICYEIIC